MKNIESRLLNVTPRDNISADDNRERGRRIGGRAVICGIHVFVAVHHNDVVPIVVCYRVLGYLVGAFVIPLVGDFPNALKVRFVV